MNCKDRERILSRGRIIHVRRLLNKLKHKVQDFSYFYPLFFNPGLFLCHFINSEPHPRCVIAHSRILEFIKLQYIVTISKDLLYFHRFNKNYFHFINCVTLTSYLHKIFEIIQNDGLEHFNSCFLGDMIICVPTKTVLFCCGLFLFKQGQEVKDTRRVNC